MSSATLPVPARRAGQQQPSRVLSFRLGSEYAIDLQAVHEIRPYESPAALPDAPAWLQGVLQLRGAIVPIVDLRARLGMPTVPRGAATVLIMLGGAQPTAGLVVDAVHDVFAVAEGDLQPGDSLGNFVDADMLAGILTRREGGTESPVFLVDSGWLTHAVLHGMQ